jgi:hypothetical protein
MPKKRKRLWEVDHPKDPKTPTSISTSAPAIRQRLMKQIRQTPNPLFQSLMDLEKLGESYGIETLMDYDPDTSDIDIQP